MREATMTTIGDIARVVTRKVNPATLAAATPYLGLEHIDPRLPSPTRWACARDVTSQVSMFEPGDTLFGRLRPYLRKVALADREGCCTPEVLVLRARAGAALPEYLHALLSSVEVVEEAVRLSSGSRMPRTSAADLMRMPVTVPPLDVQRRVVSLLRSMDAAIATLASEADAALRVLHAYLDETFAPRPDSLAIGDLAQARSGPSWAATDEFAAAPGGDATAVVKITNTRPDGSFDTSQMAYVRGLPRSTTLLGESSIVVIRTNGNRERIGNTYLPPLDALGAAVSAFQFHLEVRQPEDRDYIYWFLRSPQAQTLMSDAASGTTGLGNLALSTLRGIEVPWLTDVDRQEACAGAWAISRHRDALVAERDALLDTRDTIATGLLSGAYAIPESYDDVMRELTEAAA